MAEQEGLAEPVAAQPVADDVTVDEADWRFSTCRASTSPLADRGLRKETVISR